MRSKSYIAVLTALALLLTATLIFTANASAAPSSPLLIDGDDDLLAQADDNGWPGAGTAVSPIVIANLDIDASSAPWRGITIKNTDLYVTINNCVVSGATATGGGVGYGIWFYNAANITVADSDLSLNDHGFLINLCDNITVSNNYVNTSKICGITVTSSRDIDIAGNHIVAPRYSEGIKLYQCSYSEVSWNDVTGQGGGVEALISHNCTISNNVLASPALSYLDPNLHVQMSQDIAVTGNGITTPKGPGFLLEDSSRVVITGNQFATPGDGNCMFISRADHLTVSNNQLSGLGNGIDMWHSHNSTIVHNIFDLISFSARSVFSNHIDISYNDCRGGRYGECIQLLGAGNNTVSYNTISADGSLGINFGGRGIALNSASMFNAVTENTITAGAIGIQVTDLSRYNSVSRNTISNTHYGIHVRPADVYDPIRYNQVENNTVSDCEKGICAEIVAYTTIANNTVSNCNTGIWIRSSTYTWVADNTVSSCDYGMKLGPDGFLEPGPNQYVNVTRNSVHNIDYTGIIAHMVEDCSFWYNEVNSCGIDGIYLDSTYHNLVGSNQIGECYGNGVHGFFSTGDVISGNNIGPTGDAGVCVEYSDEYLVIGNIIGMCNNGIELYLAYDSVIAYNEVRYIVNVGILMDDSRRNVVDRNVITDFGECGIAVTLRPPSAPMAGPRDTFEGNTITNNTIASEAECGISLYVVGENTVRGNTVEGCYEGVRISDSQLNVVLYNNVSYAEFGIALYCADECTVSFNNVSFIEMIGIWLDMSSYCLVEGNDVSEFEGAGILLGEWESGEGGLRSEYSYGPGLNTVTGNTITGGYVGIALSSCEDNTVSHNMIVGASEAGIAIVDGYYNTVSSNTIADCEDDGISLEGSSDNTLESNTVSRVYCGVALYDSEGNNVLYNVITDTWDACIYLGGSNGNRMFENQLASLYGVGIQLDSCFADIEGNVMVDCAIMITFNDVFSSEDITPEMVITSNNTVNGLPVLFVKDSDMADGTASAGQGEVILINVTRLNVVGQDLSYGCVIIAFSDNVTVSGNTISDAVVGVMVQKSENCTIEENSIVYTTGERGYFNSVGVKLIDCVYNTVRDNSICLVADLAGSDDSQWTGIDMLESDHNALLDNAITITGSGARPLSVSGVLMMSCEFNTVEGNSVTDLAAFAHSGTGMASYQFYDNKVLGNTVKGWPNYGLYFFGAQRNDVVGNAIFGSGGYGIYLYVCYTNNIYGNMLVGNNHGGAQASDDETNSWNNATFGNYWSDWYYPDDNHDGIVDTPYAIDGGAADNKPVVVYLDTTAPSFVDNTNYTKEYTCDVAGTALDVFGIVEVQWYNTNTSASGVCNGASTWSGAVGLVIGNNTVWFTLVDEFGFEFYISRTIVCSPGPVVTIDRDDTSYTNQSSSRVYMNITSLSPLSGANWTQYINGVEVAHGMLVIDPNNNKTYNGSTLFVLGVGTNRICFQANDTTGKVTFYNMTIVHDIVKPVVHVVSPINGALNGTGDVSFQYAGDDDLAGIEYYLVKLDNEDWERRGGQPYTRHDLANGTHTFTVRAVDRAGNYNETTTTFIVDRVPPTLAITGPASGALTNQNTMVFTWAGSDSISGLAGYRYRLDQGAWSAVVCMEGVTLTNLADGTHTVDVEVYDNVGHMTGSSVTFTVDTVAPTVTGHSPASEVDTAGLSVSATFSEAMNQSSVQVVVNGLAGTLSWSGNMVTFTPSAAVAHNTSYAVQVSGKDLAGNPVEYSWAFRTAPQVVLPSVTGTVTGPDGQPLAGVTVSLSNGMTATTDARGRYAFTGVTAGSYTLTMAKDGYQTQTKSVTVASGETSSVAGVSMEATSPGGSAPSNDALLIGGAALAVVALLAVALIVLRRRK